MPTRKFTKDEIRALGPCYPWDPVYIDVYLEDEASAAEIKAYVESLGHGNIVAWLMAGTIELVDEFRAIGVDVNVEGPRERRPLHFAAVAKRVDVITHLRANGGDNEIEDADGYTPKDVALATGDAVVIAAMGA